MIPSAGRCGSVRGWQPAGGLATAALAVVFAAPGGVLADPPRVATLEPPDGAVDVDPKTTELIIRFDQDMRIEGFSICGGGPTFPKLRGRPVWRDARTLVLRVKLAPDHRYEMSVNCPSAQNCVGADGVPSVPAPWRFSTSSQRSPADQAGLNEHSLDELMEALAESYSHFDRKQVDWKARADDFREKIRASNSTTEWIERVAEMLSVAEDLHLWIRFNGEIVPTHRRHYEANFNLDGVRFVLESLRRRSDHVWTARTEDGIGYLLIPDFSGDREARVAELDSLLAELKDTRGLIVDVRPNGGGDELMARAVAAWFVEGKHVYSKHRFRYADAKGGFGPVRNREITGNDPPKRFDKRVAVLMGPANVSSCESFLLMMKQGRRVRLFGANSGGSSGNPKPRLLENGVEVFIPSWKDLLPDGAPLEGHGIEPDITIKTKPSDFEDGDPVLERALQGLRKKKKR